VCFRVCKVIFMSWLKIAMSHQSFLEVFSVQLLVLATVRVISMSEVGKLRAACGPRRHFARPAGQSHVHR